MSSLLALISNARDQDEFEVDHGLKNAMISGLEIVVQLGWGCGAQPHVNEEWQSQGFGEQVIECVGVCVCMEDGIGERAPSLQLLCCILCFCL